MYPIPLFRQHVTPVPVSDGHDRQCAVEVTPIPECKADEKKKSSVRLSANASCGFALGSVTISPSTQHNAMSVRPRQSFCGLSLIHISEPTRRA